MEKNYVFRYLFEFVYVGRAHELYEALIDLIKEKALKQARLLKIFGGHLL